MICYFGVRHDNRGTLIESITMLNDDNSDEYFFKHHDQPLYRHCEQIQKIVKSANVLRSKKIKVDISEFIHEYFLDNTVMFRGTKLNPVNQQIQKAFSTKLNKEMGAVKRAETVKANKQAKIEKKNNKIAMKMETAELKFQAERTRRLAQLFGEPDPQAPPTPAVNASQDNAPKICAVSPLQNRSGQGEGSRQNEGQGIVLGRGSGVRHTFRNAFAQVSGQRPPQENVLGHGSGHSQGQSIELRHGSQGLPNLLDLPDLPDYDDDIDMDE